VWLYPYLYVYPAASCGAPPAAEKIRERKGQKKSKGAFGRLDLSSSSFNTHHLSPLHFDADRLSLSRLPSPFTSHQLVRFPLDEWPLYSPRTARTTNRLLLPLPAKQPRLRQLLFNHHHRLLELVGDKKMGTGRRERDGTRSTSLGSRREGRARREECWSGQRIEWELRRTCC
jgi:hypothetical protein